MEYDIEEIRRTVWANSCDWFPEVHTSSERVLVHCALGLGGESGEAVDVVKKWHRKDVDPAAPLANLNMAALGAELADTLIYLLHICTATGIDIAEEVEKKCRVNSVRFGRLA